MTLKTNHTPSCKGKENELFQIHDLNRKVDLRKFRYLKCDSCGLIRLDNVPSNLGDYYPSDYYELPSLKQLSGIANANPFKIEIIKRFKEQGNLLEIGPAYGVFALQAKNAGFDVDVIEMDERCCEHLENIVGVNAVCSNIPHDILTTLPKHDVIALWHVIEHLSDPWSLIDSAAKNLKNNGILVIAAPNPDSWQFKVMRKWWPHVDAPRHLYLLPSKTLLKYAEQHGLECIHYTTSDSDVRSWNRFGWQRFLMNRVSNKWLERICFVIGYFFSILVFPFEAFGNTGSAYTIVLKNSR